VLIRLRLHTISWCVFYWGELPSLCVSGQRSDTNTRKYGFCAKVCP